MIIYCTKLWLGCDITHAIEQIINWQSLESDHRTLGYHMDLDVEENTLTFEGNGVTVHLEKDAAHYPMSYAFRFTHTDDEIQDRQWITEIGIEQEHADSLVHVSVVLETSEHSVIVDTAPAFSRPRVVFSLMKLCRPVAPTAGVEPLHIDESNADVLATAINDPERRTPIILVSPTVDGTYLFNFKQLQFHSAGIAELCVINPFADIAQIERIVSRRYTAFDGAVNIIHPLAGAGNQSISSRLLSANELIESGNEIAQIRQIMTIVTHRMNLPNRRLHVAPGHVRERRLRRRLERYPAELATLEEIIDEHGRDQAEQYDEITRLKGEVDDLSLQVYELEEVSRDLNSQLQIAWSQRGLDAESAAAQDILIALIEALRLDHKSLTLVDALNFLQTFFPDRVLILPDAIASAEEAASFRHAKKAFWMMWRLVTDFYQCMSEDGKGTANCKQVFSDKEYSASEAAPMRSRARAVDLRTFHYMGEEVAMFQHLRIGNKDSIVETWRCHFHWDEANKKIIIGHCGKHLNFK